MKQYNVKIKSENSQNETKTFTVKVENHNDFIKWLNILMAMESDKNISYEEKEIKENISRTMEVQQDREF